MEKNESLRKYELMVIVDAKLPTDEKETTCKNAADIVQKGGGKIINSQKWLDKHKFSFQIKKCMEGTYYLINYEAQGSANEKIKSDLKLYDKILRFAITHVESAKTAKAALA